MAAWLIFIGCSVAALWLCWLERSTARAIWQAAMDDGLTGVRRLLARTIKEEASLRVVLALQFLLMAVLATANALVYGPTSTRPNAFQIAMRLDLISMPCVVLWKAMRNRSASRALADAALHTAEFEDEMHQPYMRALWEATSILVVDMDSGVILQASDMADQMFGYPPGALLGLNVERLVPDAHRPDHVAYRREYARAPKVRAMGATSGLSGRRMDGSAVPLLIQLVPVLGNSRVVVMAFESHEVAA